MGLTLPCEAYKRREASGKRLGRAAHASAEVVRKPRYLGNSTTGRQPRTPQACLGIRSSTACLAPRTWCCACSSQAINAAVGSVSRSAHSGTTVRRAAEPAGALCSRRQPHARRAPPPPRLRRLEPRDRGAVLGLAACEVLLERDDPAVGLGQPALHPLDGRLGDDGSAPGVDDRGLELADHTVAFAHASGHGLREGVVLDRTLGEELAVGPRQLGAVGAVLVARLEDDRPHDPQPGPAAEQRDDRRRGDQPAASDGHGTGDERGRGGEHDDRHRDPHGALSTAGRGVTVHTGQGTDRSPSPRTRHARSSTSPATSRSSPPSDASPDRTSR